MNYSFIRQVITLKEAITKEVRLLLARWSNSNDVFPKGRAFSLFLTLTRDHRPLAISKLWERESSLSQNNTASFTAAQQISGFSGRSRWLWYPFRVLRWSTLKAPLIHNDLCLIRLILASHSSSRLASETKGQVVAWHKVNREDTAVFEGIVRWPLCLHFEWRWP